MDLTEQISKEEGMETDRRGSGHEHRSTTPWAVIVKFEIKEGCEAEWLRLVQEVLDAMRHEKTFISTSMCAHPSEPGTFMLFEVWEDRDEFFAVQTKREYRRALTERLPELTRAPVTFDEWTEIRADYAIHARRGPSQSRGTD
ncbi:putative quinol monooxygenase [Nocardia terpenica]|nr:antibiotic biosynthesis monooxygenase [Nocardia terpenica]